jgi:hypothetical protein
LEGRFTEEVRVRKTFLHSKNPSAEEHPIAGTQTEETKAHKANTSEPK